MMKILLLLLLAVTVTHCTLCAEPQRSFYMSFQALSKRDTLENLFQELSPNMSVMENNYTDSTLGANFVLTNIHPHPFYNDHEQRDSFIDKYSCNVSMGVLSASSFFDYSIKYANSNKTGKFRVKGYFDPSYFTKKLVMTDGYLQWKLDHVPAFTLSQDFLFEYANPNVTDEERKVILQMINGRAGMRKIKDQFVIQLNTKFAPLLSQRLNHEELIANNNITYNYSNISMAFANYAKQFELSNDNTKGLEVFLIYGLQNSTQNCTSLPKQFNEKEYGGLQQLYTFSTVRAIFKQALSKGLFDKTLDSSWEVSGFQFFMGDLGNFVPYANRAPASDPFKVTCKFNTSRAEKELKISRYDKQQLYVSVPEACNISYKDKAIIEMELDVNMVLRLFGESKSIRVEVESAGMFGLVWRSLDSNYQLGDPYVASYSITEILNGLVGKTVFGTDFPTIYRRYPVVRVLEDMVIVFDPSEY